MITQEEKTKNEQTISKVTNGQSKQLVEKINNLVSEVQEGGPSKGKSFLVLAKFAADDINEKSIQAAGVVGNHGDLAQLIAETMSMSEEFKHVILQAATMFTLGDMLKLNVFGEDAPKSTEPFTYKN